MKQPFSPEEFRDIYSRVPRLTVDIVVRSEKGILLTLRTLPSWNNMWHLPGGTVYYRERLHQAVQRIAGEEVGIDVEIEKLLGYIEYPSEEEERGFGWSVGAVFLCTAKSGAIRGSAQAREVRFFKQLPENTIAEVREFLEKHDLP